MDHQSFSVERAARMSSHACRLMLWTHGQIRLEDKDIITAVTELELLCAVASQLRKTRER